jgi:hypothetical protein
MNQSSSTVRNIVSSWHHPSTFVEGKIRQRLEKYRQQPPEKQGKSLRKKQNIENTDWTDAHRYL